MDREEVRQVVEMFKGQMTDAELDEAMQQLDESGDGQVDFPEFRKYWFENIGSGGCDQGIVCQICVPSLPRFLVAQPTVPNKRWLTL